MTSLRLEKLYEKYAWILLFLAGVPTLLGALPHLLGIDPDPAPEETIIGMTLSELKASNPRFFDFYVFYTRLLGVFFLGFALPVIAISVTGYRRGEKWAWYAFWYLPAWFMVNAAVLLTTGRSPSFPAVLTFILSLLGLLLPYRKFFPKKQPQR